MNTFGRLFIKKRFLYIAFMKPALLFCTIAALSLISACTNKKTLSASADKAFCILPL